MIADNGRSHRVLCTVHEVRLADHHRRVVTIPLTLSVFVGVATAENLLLKLLILEPWLREHILEVFVACAELVLELDWRGAHALGGSFSALIVSI